MKEAEELFTSYTKEKSARDEKNLLKKSFGNKPAPYVKLKTNKPMGNCPVYRDGNLRVEVIVKSCGNKLKPAPDWLRKSEQPIRSQSSKLTQLLT